MYWTDDRLIKPTPGNVADCRAVEDCIRGLCDRFNVVSVCIDPQLDHSTLNTLAEDGYPAVEVRQGWVDDGTSDQGVGVHHRRAAVPARWA